MDSTCAWHGYRCVDLDVGRSAHALPGALVDELEDLS